MENELKIRADDRIYDLVRDVLGRYIRRDAFKEEFQSDYFNAQMFAASHELGLLIEHLSAAVNSKTD